MLKDHLPYWVNSSTGQCRYELVKKMKIKNPSLTRAQITGILNAARQSNEAFVHNNMWFVRSTLDMAILKWIPHYPGTVAAIDIFKLFPNHAAHDIRERLHKMERQGVIKRVKIAVWSRTKYMPEEVRNVVITQTEKQKRQVRRVVRHIS